MPKSDYAQFDFYHYRSPRLDAVNGFSVISGVEAVSAPRSDPAPVITAEALSMLDRGAVRGGGGAGKLEGVS